ncbi:MAG TPA: type III pantothenate kinase, partial [Gammaproteobacteria bacterium]|nr:type III pantothenate kinase [Gammaproteobacteria bacterium]
RHAFPGRAVCIADCGTAVTIDCLDGGGRHEGGVILPGLTLMQESLYAATAGLAPQCPSELERGRLGRDTASGIFLGCRHALAGAMERVAAESSEEGGAPVCLITGGAAPALLPYLDSRWQLRSHLVLEGARILAQERPPGDGP